MPSRLEYAPGRAVEERTEDEYHRLLDGKRISAEIVIPTGTLQCD